MRSISVQRHRINRVVNYTQTNFSESLNLDALADVACLSRYHFTRVFQSHLGRSPFEFLTSCRLEKAAQKLAHEKGTRITDIALECGFSSSQTFSRAFKERYHLSPRRFRESGNWLLAQTEKETSIRGIENGTGLTVSIEARLEYRVAYVRHIGPYLDLDGGISRTFTTLYRWARDHGFWHHDAFMMGLCPNNPVLTPSDLCMYDVAIPVPDWVTEDETVSIQVIPAGTYAVLTVSGSPTEIYLAWEWLGSTWLPTTNANYVLNNNYEIYRAVNGRPGDTYQGVELCMRIS